MPVQRRRQNIRLSTPEPSEEDLKRLEAMLGGGSEMRIFLEATGSPQIAKALKPTKQKIKSSVALLDDATPVDQQPAQELDDLKSDSFFGLGQLSDEDFLKRLGLFYTGLFSLVSLPISLVTYDWASETLALVAAANTGTVAILSLFLVRLYVGWSYVGDRLSKDVGYYEQSGWYDGFVAVKPAEISNRDRLLYDFEVAPVLGRVTKAAVAGMGLFAASLLLLRLAAPGDPYAELDPDYLSTLQSDDNAAALEQQRRSASGKPTYCLDRYYRAVAGGNGC